MRELLEACEAYMAHLASQGGNADEDADYENAIFEKALEMCMGTDIFHTVNELIADRDAREDSK